MKNNGKCILLVRVSTQRQDFDEQENQLYNLAVADGYSDSDIIPICEKESGIKLAEEERNGLNRMKEVISEGGVNCVYAWEVSRIGRKKKVIFSIVEYLQTRNIQLIIKEPYIKLLNEDGTINDAAETILTLYAQMAESEMRNKQSRWKRTRKANALKGKWNGGKTIKFGYKLDDNNFYAVNEDEANIIRLVYDLYLNNDYGQVALKKELAERGIILTEDRIRRILSGIGYCGETYTTVQWQDGKRVNGYDITYPAIISKEMFEAAKKKRESNNGACYRGENYYFAKGLLKCPVCGHSFIGFKVQKVYMCIAHKHDHKDFPQCPNPMTININILDTILWCNTWIQYTNYLLSNLDEQRDKMEEEIKVYNQKIVAAEKDIEKNDTKIERVAELYADGIYNKEKYQSELAKVRESSIELRQNIVSYKSNIERLNKILSKSNDTDKELDQWAEVVKDVQNTDNLKRMYDLVHQFISSVEIEDNIRIENKRARKVIIHQIDGITKTYYGYVHNDKYRFWIKGVDKYVDFPIDKIIQRKLGRNEKWK